MSWKKEGKVLAGISYPCKPELPLVSLCILRYCTVSEFSIINMHLFYNQKRNICLKCQHRVPQASLRISEELKSIFKDYSNVERKLSS